MFNLIATVYILMNGQPVGEPMKATNRTTFDSMESCKEFAGSETGKKALESLNAQIAGSLPAGGSQIITTSCEAAKDDTT